MKPFYLLFLLSVLFSSTKKGLAQPVAPPATFGSVSAYEQAIKYYRYYKPDSASYLAKKGLLLARQKGEYEGEAYILLQTGMMDDNQGAFDSAQAKYRQALALFRRVGSEKGVASATIRLGVVDLRNGQYDRASKFFLDALKLAEKVGDKAGMMEAYYSLSWAWLDQKKWDKTLFYLQLADSLNQQLSFSSLSLNIYNHFGVAYRETGDLKQAKYYLQKGIEKSNEPEYQGLNITLINNLATVYGREGNVHTAVQLHEKALQRARTIGNYLRELQTLLGLAKTYRKHNVDSAIVYLQQAVLLSKAKKLPNQEIRALQMLSDYHKKSGNFEAALAAKEREHALSDTFFYKRVEENMSALKAEYELSKSRAKIKELDLVANKRDLELKNAATLRIVFVGGLVLLLIIICLLYNQYRIKQRTTNEILQKNLSLQRLVEEKEWLLKEVHHRVKNNLHTIISLLETQSAFLTDKALAAVQDSQHRVYAMSLIHQRLYQVEDSTTVSMSVYMADLLSYLKESMAIGSRICFRSHIEKIDLDISQAIPLGLIINEAVTNAIKYAFPDGRQGEISVHLTCPDGQTVFLQIADNGIGLPPDWKKKLNHSIGLKLMQGLSTDIQANFRIETILGTRIVVEFEKVQFSSGTDTETSTHRAMSFL